MCGDCGKCAKLDKSIKEYDPKTKCYIYGCKHNGRTHCVGWVRTDSELSSQGCSFFQEIVEDEQMKIDI